MEKATWPPIRLLPKQQRDQESSSLFFFFFFRPALSIHAHRAFLQRACLVLVLVFLGRRWRAARLQHLLEHLITDTTHRVVLCDGNVSQLVVMAQMGGISVPMLVGQPLAVCLGEGGGGQEGEMDGMEGEGG